ncbi:MAG: ornithine carbamoyltransferase [Deltaproteobacteria bacterium]|nr:MAG: ornithine carbamoyltransferase [Deltaproteobacteria bacterium]
MSEKRKPNNFLDLAQWSRRDLDGVLALAAELKADPAKFSQSLAGKSLAMIFKKSSTRTRVSFEVGMFQLGGQAIFMSSTHTQVGRGEPLEDTARVLSRYVDGIMIRTYEHAEVETLAQYATVPVINGLTDFFHPCQVLTDIFTIQEHLGISLSGLKVAYIGDGNNMANSWINAALQFGFDLKIAAPDGYEPDAILLERVRQQAAGGGQVSVVNNPLIAAQEAQVLNTDVWASMGQEEEAESRRQVFAGYQINEDLLKVAAPEAMVLHCLPAHRGEEITAETFERFQDLIFTQAENRLHVQKALLVTLLGD